MYGRTCRLRLPRFFFESENYEEVLESGKSLKQTCLETIEELIFTLSCWATWSCRFGTLFEEYVWKFQGLWCPLVPKSCENCYEYIKKKKKKKKHTFKLTKDINIDSWGIDKVFTSLRLVQQSKLCGGQDSTQSVAKWGDQKLQSSAHIFWKLKMNHDNRRMLFWVEYSN